MGRFRAKIREKLPFTTEIYEFAIAKKGMFPFKKRFTALSQSSNAIRLDLGGADPGTGEWTSVDMTLQCDINWDLILPIPLPSGSVSKIYSSHLLEHLTYDQGQGLLRTRFLGRGGQRK